MSSQRSSISNVRETADLLRQSAAIIQAARQHPNLDCHVWDDEHLGEEARTAEAWAMALDWATGRLYSNATSRPGRVPRRRRTCGVSDLGPRRDERIMK